MWVLPQIQALRATAEVHVVIPDEPGRLSETLDLLAKEDPGIVIWRTSYSFGFSPRPSNLRQFFRFARQLRRQRFDAVLYHLYASALASRIALFATKTRKVHMVAGPLHLESAPIRAVERVLHHLDDVIICGSDATHRRYLALGIPPEKLVSIPYGVDTAKFTPQDPDRRRCARKDLGVLELDFLVVMVAYVYPPKRLVHAGRGIKGHEDLLVAWDAFSRYRRDARLLIVGGGFQQEGEEHRAQLISDLPRSLQSMGVTWLDTVRDVRGVYSAADVSVSPSLSENHGAALEASAMGVPSIVSNAGGLPETVLDRSSGWIFTAGDVSDLECALEKAYEAWTSGTLSKMSESSRDFAVANFDSTDAARRVAHVVLTGGS